MKKIRLLLLISLPFIYEGLFAQARLQITQPSCAQLPLCDGTLDASATPCGSLSYGSVEAGLVKIKTVSIANNGSISSLQGIKIKLIQDGLTNNTGYWEILTSATVTALAGGEFAVSDIPATSPATLRNIQIRFKPDLASAASGALPVLLKITTTNSDFCYPDTDPSAALDVLIRLSGTAIRTPVNYAMVLDRSGSMDWLYGSTPGNPRRIDLLKIAANYFVDLLEKRNNLTVVDKLGMIRFDDVATPALLPMASFSEPSATTALSSAELTPRNGTGIGNALTEADNLFSSATEKNVIVLFTDGEENIPPAMNSVSFTKNPIIYSIGLGTVNQNALQTLSGTDRYYLVPPSIPATGPDLPIDLKKAYLDIFTNSTDLEMVVDPVFEVFMTNTNKVVAGSWITSSDRSAIFSVFDKPRNREKYEIAIQSPKGEWVTNGTLASGMTASITSRHDYSIFSIDFNGAKDPTDFVGEWKLILKAKGRSSDSTAMPIGFATTVFSNLRMDVNLGAANYEPGNDIDIAIDAEDSGIDVDPVQIDVVVTDPNGKQTPLKTTKDAYGKWVVSFPHTYQQGTYQVFVRAMMMNSKRELTTRERTKFIALNHPKPSTIMENDCIPCKSRIIVIVIVIVLLIAILFFIYKTRKG